MNERPRRSYRTKSGRILTDTDFEALATEAEERDDLSEPPRRLGRPLIGAAPAVVVPIRLQADLLGAVKALAAAEETSVSELVRDALSDFLSTEPRPGAPRTSSGRVFGEADFEALADDAEQVDDATPLGRSLKRRRGVRAEVVAVRMPPELKDAVERRAEKDETSVSEVVRAALRVRTGGDNTDPPRGGAATEPPAHLKPSQGRRSRITRGDTGSSAGSMLGHSPRLGPRERDTCRDYVLPRLKAAGWSDDQIRWSSRLRTAGSSPSGQSTGVETPCGLTTCSSSCPACRWRWSRRSASTRSPARACSRRRTMRSCSTCRSPTRRTGRASSRMIARRASRPTASTRSLGRLSCGRATGRGRG